MALNRTTPKLFFWLSKAAEQGHIESMGLLGTCYRFARGVKRNTVLAAKLHVKAATAGDVISIANLTEYRKAIEKYALIGSVRAALCLATLYKKGVTVEKNAAIGKRSNPVGQPWRLMPGDLGKVFHQQPCCLGERPRDNGQCRRLLATCMGGISRPLASSAESSMFDGRPDEQAPKAHGYWYFEGHPIRQDLTKSVVAKSMQQ
jgi:hypothetical protein